MARSLAAAVKLEAVRAALFDARPSVLGPRLMATYEALRAERGGRLSFVEFVRLIDPTVPMGAREYRRHKTYAACMYLRRVAAKGGA